MKEVFFLLCVFLVVSSCEKSGEEDSGNSDHNVFITVYNAETWSAENINGDIVAGADVEIYRDKQSDADSPLFEIQTDDDGKFSFRAYDNVSYQIYIKKGSLTNVINPVYLEENTVGYIASRIFQVEDLGFTGGQTMVTNQPYFVEHGDTLYAQSNAQPGDLQIYDINGDMVISEYDKTSGYLISTSGNYKIIMAESGRHIPLVNY